MIFHPAFFMVERPFRRGEKDPKPPGRSPAGNRSPAGDRSPAGGRQFLHEGVAAPAPVSYNLERALEGRRTTIASRGRRPTSSGAWLLDTGYCLSKGGSGNSPGALVALGPNGLGKAPSIIRCSDATSLKEGGLVTEPCASRP